MTIAPDGKPYHIDNLAGNPLPHEVEVIQYLRPNGLRRRMFAPVGEDYARMSADTKLILSAEELDSGHVILYGRRATQDEESEISELAFNGPGANSPTNKLRLIIKRLTM